MKRWVLFAGLTAAAVAVHAQDGTPRFTSTVELVEVYATVTDATGGPVMGLQRDDFEVFENGQRREITAFASGEFPLTLALGVDRSFSMAGERLRLAKQASNSFLRALLPQDRSMVVAIGNDAEVIAPLSSDRAAQMAAIESLDAWSTTALYDAVIASLMRLEPEPGRQALVVFSDGVDRYSRASQSEVIERARRSRALIYPVVLSKTRPAIIAELAVVSGGRSFQLTDPRQLEGTLQTIARELRYQYLLGYAPSESPAGSTRAWQSIRVGLKSPRPGLRIRARDGYFAE
jgi:Ca-activated chloride channel family protein